MDLDPCPCCGRPADPPMDAWGRPLPPSPLPPAEAELRDRVLLTLLEERLYRHQRRVEF